MLTFGYAFADNPCGIQCTRTLIAERAAPDASDWISLAGTAGNLVNGVVINCPGSSAISCNKLVSTVGESSLFTHIPFASGIPTFIRKITVPANQFPGSLAFDFTNTGTLYTSCRITSASGGMFINSGKNGVADPQNEPDNYNPNTKILIAPVGFPGAQTQRLFVMDEFQAFAQPMDFYVVCTTDNGISNPSVAVQTQFI